MAMQVEIGAVGSEGLRPEEHDSQQTSCGFQAATDLIARETIEPMIYPQVSTPLQLPVAFFNVGSQHAIFTLCVLAAY
jgi:hypothetical protein